MVAMVAMVATVAMVAMRARRARTGEDHPSACIWSVGNYECTRLTRRQGHEAGARGPLPAMATMPIMAMMATPWAEPREKKHCVSCQRGVW